MFRTALIVGLGFLILGWASDNALAQDEHEGHAHHAKETAEAGLDDQPEALCPVMGVAIDKKMFAEYRGKRVYFCCAKCKAKFAAAPDKYADGVKDQWEALKPLAIQVSCPGTGKLVNRKISVETEHGPVYFCCNNCKAGWEKDSTKMQAKLKDCYTYQTNCTIMGGEIDPNVSAEIDGRTVYFCCPGCIEGFKKDKVASFKKLDEQIAKNKSAMAKRHGKKKEDKKG